MQRLLNLMGTNFATRDREGAKKGNIGGHVHSQGGVADWGSTESGAPSLVSVTTPEVAPDERAALLACIQHPAVTDSWRRPGVR